jgi:hypothetical protein
MFRIRFEELNASSNSLPGSGGEDTDIRGKASLNARGSGGGGGGTQAVDGTLEEVSSPREVDATAPDADVERGVVGKENGPSMNLPGEMGEGPGDRALPLLLPSPVCTAT